MDNAKDVIVEGSDIEEPAEEDEEVHDGFADPASDGNLSDEADSATGPHSSSGTATGTTMQLTPLRPSPKEKKKKRCQRSCSETIKPREITNCHRKKIRFLNCLDLLCRRCGN